jgi:M6 family metalloprotease-like protein
MKEYFIKRGSVTTSASFRLAALISLGLVALVAGAAFLSSRTITQASQSASNLPAPPPLDPQKVEDQQDMTWDDYHPIPGKDWADPSLVPERKLRIALVAVDFPDQPFVITLPKRSDLFGNPQIDPISRDQVPQFYADFYNKPESLNHGHTVNGYWMEQSRGKIGIPPIDAYGPYLMPKKLFQYGLNEWKQQDGCPSGYKCDGRLERDADALWRAAAGNDVAKKYDIVLRIYAGYDETSVWQEFGEMKFQTKDDISPEWGNPDTSKPRWVVTRYEPWTSWKAGQMQWGLSSIRQGESSGTITHEIAHFAFEIGDNNNNPYATPYHRVGSGPWDIMDRGSFNGPGGPHMRWVVPASEGASMPAGLMLRSKIKFKFLPDANVLKLSREGLAKSGVAVATITARAVDPGPDGLSGITVALDGPAPQDKTPACDINEDPLCAGSPVFNFYSIEVVQRIGYDSFTPDNGVLIAKNKDKESNSCGYNCFTWVVDGHPEDIHMLDFKRPDGTPVMRSIADYRQLNDALFHAGLNSGSQFEWEDTANRLHFYVIDVHKDADGILSYAVAVRSLDGSGLQKRGISLRAEKDRGGVEYGFTVVPFTLKNSGQPGAGPYAQDDVYRLSVSSEGESCSAQLRNALVAVKAGDSATIPVFVPGSAERARCTRIVLKAQSESDSRVSASAVQNVIATAD